jgi:lipid-A-disaccharide synthase
VLRGSRPSEALRHLPALVRAAGILTRDRQLSFILPASANCGTGLFEKPLAGTPIRAIDGEAWDAMAHADVALAASGTVTIEAALLGTPMVTFYRVAPLTWMLGRPLVSVPFYSMVNLVAEKRIVPELIQSDMTGERIASEAARLIDGSALRAKMKEELARVAARLANAEDRMSADPISRAADEVERVLLTGKQVRSREVSK